MEPHAAGEERAPTVRPRPDGYARSERVERHRERHRPAARGARPGQALPDNPGHHLPAPDRRRQSGRRRVVRRPAGRDARDRRRDRVWQEHDRAAARAAARPDRRRDPLRGRGHRQAYQERRASLKAAAPGGADDLPGSVLVAQSPPARWLDHRRAVRHPWAVQGRGRAQAARPGSDGPRRAEPRALQPLPARVLRRPAPADRGRPGDRARAQAADRRRAGVRSGCVDPGAGAQPAARPAAGHGTDADLCRARPLGRASHVRPGRGDVPGQDRRAGTADELYGFPAPPVHGRAAVGRASP